MLNPVESMANAVANHETSAVVNFGSVRDAEPFYDDSWAESAAIALGLENIQIHWENEQEVAVSWN